LRREKEKERKREREERKERERGVYHAEGSTSLRVKKHAWVGCPISAIEEFSLSKKCGGASSGTGEDPTSP